jgi:cytochrome c peroxidase
MVDGVFTPPEWKKVQSYSPVPMPPPSSPTNRFADDERAAAFGQRMWFEKRYSGAITVVGPGAAGGVGETGKYSCASCHDAKSWFIDTRTAPNTLSIGAANVTKRNSPSMVNIAYYKWGGWGGAQDQFWKQGANSPETKDLAGDRLGIAHLIYEHYRSDYESTFQTELDPALSADDNSGRFPPNGKPGDLEWDSMNPNDQLIVNRIQANLGKAFEAYERRLVSRDAPFDQYVAGNHSALTMSTKRGLRLFIGKAGCDKCHSNQTFSDQEFHNTAVPQTAPYDLGRFDDVGRLQNPFNGAGMFSDDKEAGLEKIDGVVQTDDMRGQFRTKSLRQVAETGPYFHNGSATTLEDVIRHYNKGGATESYPGNKDMAMVPLNLTESEIQDLVAFLKSLTGQPVPEELTIDTSAP